MRTLILLPGLAIATLLTACGGGGGDQQEDINALRTFGIAASPLVTTPSATTESPSAVEVTLYAAVPTGATATLSPYADDGSTEGATMIGTSAITVDPSTAQYVEYNNYRLFSEKAKIVMPTAAAFRGGPFVGAQVRYGLTVATATDHEDVIASLALYPAGSPQLAWQSPGIDIAAPVADGTVSTASDVDLNASFTNPQNEELKIGWFVTDGTVGNRRASATTWKLSHTGTETVAVTIHGISSRGFALKVVNVTAD
jgi:hypothetical protein